MEIGCWWAQCFSRHLCSSWIARDMMAGRGGTDCLAGGTRRKPGRVVIVPQKGVSGTPDLLDLRSQWGYEMDISWVDVVAMVV